MSAPLERLAVDLAVPNPGVANLNPNPSGAGGSVAGWVTPVSGSAMSATSTSGGVNDHGFAGDKLIYTAAGGVANYFHTTHFPVTPGDWIAARWKALYVDGAYTQRIEFLNASLTVVASTMMAGPRTAMGSTPWCPSGPQPVPAGAVYARLRFDLYGDINGANPVAGADLLLRDVQVATAATSAALGTRRINWVNNGGAEDNTSTWFPSNQGTVTSTATPQSPVTVLDGARSFELIAGFAGDQILSWNTGSSPRVDRTQHPQVHGVISMRSGPFTQPRSIRMRINVRTYGTGSGTVDVDGPVVLLPGSAGARVDYAFTFTLPTTGTDPLVAIQNVTVHVLGMAAAERVYFDQWQLVLGTAPGAIFSHASPDADGIAYDHGFSSTNSLNTRFGAVEHTFTASVISNPFTWTEITGAHGELTIARRPLDAGTLTALLKPANLPVGLDPHIKPGNGYRARLGTEPLFTGEILAREAALQVAIPPVKVSAADAGRVLTSAPKASGVGELAHLAWTLEDLGVPWRINGSSAQVATPPVTATNNKAKAIDQVAMTRDLKLPAYAWISRDGTVTIEDLTNLDGTVQATLNEDDLTFFEQGYARCVNIVTVKVGTTTYGPYKDVVSIDRWGEQAATLTLQGSAVTSTVAQTVAQALLDANSEPAFQVIAVNVAIKRADQDPIALLDLYDLVRVQHAGSGTDQLLRVTAIDHEISPGRWLVKLRFDLPGVAALPQVIPDP